MQHTRLRVIEPQHTGKKQRTHFADRCTDRDAALTENIPERNRRLRESEVGHAALFKASIHLFAALTGFSQAGQVALHICQEHRHAELREALCQYLQRDSFAGAGRAGNQAVSVCHFRQQAYSTVRARSYPDFLIVQHVSSSL